MAYKADKSPDPKPSTTNLSVSRVGGLTTNYSRGMLAGLAGGVKMRIKLFLRKTKRLKFGVNERIAESKTSYLSSALSLSLNSISSFYLSMWSLLVSSYILFVYDLYWSGYLGLSP